MAEKSNASTHKRLFLACVPRCVSTSLTKCLSAIDDDHEVWFEPYISCNFALIEYEVRTGKKLELEYEGNEREYEKAAVFIENQGVDIKDVNNLSHLETPSSEPKLISYPEIKKCLETASSRLVIVKDFGIAVDGFYEYLPSVEAGYKYIFLIRDPLLMAMSYRRSVIAFEKKNHGLLDDSNFDLSADKFYPGWGEAFRRQHEFWRHVRANIDPNPLIIDTEDLLAQPEACIRKICEVSGLEYSDALLKWDAATKSDEWIKYANTAMGRLMRSGFLSDFHTGAMKSTGFTPSTKRKPDESEITPDVRRIVERGMKYYKEMYDSRFRPDV